MYFFYFYLFYRVNQLLGCPSCQSSGGKRRRYSRCPVHIILTWISLQGNVPPEGGHLFRAVCVCVCVCAQVRSLTIQIVNTQIDPENKQC